MYECTYNTLLLLQITCQAALESHATITANNRLDGTVYTTTTNERNEQCILGIRS